MQIPSNQFYINDLGMSTIEKQLDAMKDKSGDEYKVLMARREKVETDIRNKIDDIRQNGPSVEEKNFILKAW